MQMTQPKWKIIEDMDRIIICPTDANPDDIAFGRFDRMNNCQISDMLPAYDIVREVVKFFNMMEVGK